MDESFEPLVKALLDYLNSQEAAIKQLKVEIGKILGLDVEKPKASIPEETFGCLKWQTERGAVLGEYETAYKNQNVLENWQHAFNILKHNNSVISNPFHLEGYHYRYWIYLEKYEDRIFRKKLGESKPQNG